MQYQRETPSSIRSLFNHIAPQYDRTNSLLSFSLHHVWNRTLARHLAKVSPRAAHTFVDLCAGTGEITSRYLHRLTVPCRALLVDFSPEMLNCARQKFSERPPSSIHAIDYLEADVHSVPFPTASAAIVSMAYGIRNVHSPEKVIQEIWRLLQPGGYMGILELTRPSHPFVRAGHALYLQALLPFMGKWFTQDPAAYCYLKESIRTFSEPATLLSLIHQVGFAHTLCRPLMGGIATLFIGKKPL